MILLADLETPSSSRRSADRKAVFRKNRKSTNRPATAGEKAKSLVPPKDPYGRTTLVSGSNLATFQYTGDYAHQASGLNLTKYRAYDPNTGRWLSRDPLKDAERLQVPNLYEYVFNDPTRYTDPDGRVVPVIIPAAIIIVGTIEEIYKRYHACERLKPGEEIFIVTPVSFLTSVGSSVLGGTAEAYSNSPVIWRMRVWKDCNGDCHYELVFIPLIPANGST